MKRGSRKAGDELRPEYRRSDFGKLVRGKYAARAARETNVVVLEPELAKRFRMRRRSMRRCEDFWMSLRPLHASPVAQPDGPNGNAPVSSR